jgi:Fe(II)/alpha-ketoglutarate-dependent arginine beta-hydroxylase
MVLTKKVAGETVESSRSSNRPSVNGKDASKMNTLSLEAAECDSIESLLDKITSQYTSIEDENFLKDSPVFAHELPRRVRAFLNDFRMLESPSGACLIRGYPIDFSRIGPTPEHWRNKPKASPVLREGILLMLFGSLLGDAVGWATQQDGHLVHDIMPIKGLEQEQLGTGSEQLLWWHNEDAFHPYRGDYIAMMCLRNPDRVATTMACIDDVTLTPEQLNVLFEPHFVIHPDESHKEKNRGCAIVEGGEETLAAAYKRINQMNAAPEKIPVLYGDPASPYMRLDPYFMDKVENEVAQNALNALIESIDNALIDVAMQPGDFLFIDNFKAVHGRRPFKARYDGNDRWLMRINITKDVRKSRDARLSCRSRIIH